MPPEGIPEEILVRREHLPMPKPYAAPRTPTERELARIWREALAMDRVGIEDSYHDLGGDSLAAAAIFAETEAVFRIEIAMATLIDAPTIAEVAQLVDRLVAASRR